VLLERVFESKSEEVGLGGVGMWFWNVVLECGFGMWFWNVVLECGFGMWFWNVVLECGFGMWFWNVVLKVNTQRKNIDYEMRRLIALNWFQNVLRKISRDFFEKKNSAKFSRLNTWSVTSENGYE
jgi:hypothetical protein